MDRYMVKRERERGDKDGGQKMGKERDKGSKGKATGYTDGKKKNKKKLAFKHKERK